MQFYHTLIFIGLITLLLTSPVSADYEIYRADGFEKVYEIIEKKENENGTFTVRAKKSKNSDQIVVIQNVVNIKDVEAKSGPKYMVRETPTPIPVKTEPVATTKPQHSSSADVPWVRKLSKTVVGVMIAIVAAFVILFIWVKSSN